MSRAGRKLKQNVARYSTGRITAAHYRADNELTLGQLNRIKHTVLRQSLDPNLATWRGQLFFAKEITATQMEAANRWAMFLAGKARFLTDTKHGLAAQSYEKRDKGRDPEIDPERIERFKDSFLRAERSLIKAGPAAQKAVEKLCRGERGPLDLGDVRRGLNSLAEYFVLTPEKKK